jgi:hypothetical protein
MTGNEDKINAVAEAMNTSPVLRGQACGLAATGNFDVKIKNRMSELFCE